MTTYDYNTGLPLAPGQAQSVYNTKTGQKIGVPATTAAPVTPAMPSPYVATPTTVVPVPKYGDPVTDASGKVVGTASFDPNTGKPLANSNGSTTTPTTPTTPSTSPTDDQTLSTLLAKYQSALMPSQTMLDLQKQAADLEAARKTADTSINGEGINVGAKSGYQANVDSQALNQETATQAQYGIAQGQQQATAQGAEAALELAKGTPLSYGGSLVNSYGQTINGGVFGTNGGTAGKGVNPSTGLTATSTTSDILGYLSVNGINPTRYDTAGLLNAIQNGATAQDIISGKVNVAAATAAGTSGNRYVFNSVTGTYTQPSPGATSLGTSGGSSSGGSSASTLQPGANGQSVQALQQFLVDNGYMSASDMSTGPGIYGPKTTAAVAAFQAANGINTSGGGSGVFGPQTSAAAAAKGLSLGGTLGTGGSGSGTSLAPLIAAANGGPSPIKPANTNPLSSLSAGALTLATSGEYPSWAKSTQQNQLLAEVQKVIPNFNPAIAKANAKAIGEQVSNQADTSRAITAADSNFGLLTSTFKNSGVNDNNSPILNQMANAVKLGVLGDSDVVNFTSAVSTLQTEYATVLGRGGEVTDAVRKSASNVINGNYSMSDLMSLHDYIDKEGKNVIASYTKTIGQLASGGIDSSSGSSSGANAGGSTYNGITLPN